MSNPGKEGRRGDRGVRVRIVMGLALLALVLPLTTLSGLSTETAGPDAPGDARKGSSAAIQERASKPTGNYRIRCWQYGRLLFEENDVVLPADLSPYSVKLRGTDRNGSPLYIADTKNATCYLQVPTARDRPSVP